MAEQSFSVKAQFDLSGRVVVITGGAGLLGTRHAEAVAEMGAVPILLDVDAARVEARAAEVAQQFNVAARGFAVNITSREAVEDAMSQVLGEFGRVDALINNAARNPQVGAAGDSTQHWSRLENFPLEEWNKDLSIGLTGALICSQVFGGEMAQRGRGVVLNIASDLGIIAPDQRIYRQPGLPAEAQPVKPVTYSVVKHGLIGLTRYLATYWAENGVRCNSLSPGGVHTGQDEAFVGRLTNLIPLGRMAHADEYKAAIVFLVSDASSYMTGANLSMDGGRTTW